MENIEFDYDKIQKGYYREVIRANNAQVAGILKNLLQQKIRQKK